MNNSLIYNHSYSTFHELGPTFEYISESWVYVKYTPESSFHLLSSFQNLASVQKALQNFRPTFQITSRILVLYEMPSRISTPLFKYVPTFREVATCKMSSRISVPPFKYLPGSSSYSPESRPHVKCDFASPLEWFPGSQSRAKYTLESRCNLLEYTFQDIGPYKMHFRISTPHFQHHPGPRFHLLSVFHDIVSVQNVLQNLGPSFWIRFRISVPCKIHSRILAPLFKRLEDLHSVLDTL